MSRANSAPRALRLHRLDNVAVATTALAKGEQVLFDGPPVTLLEMVPMGHKVALRPIARNGDVVKYGEVIGTATAAIEPGSHVHVHNVASARLPGTADRG